MNSCNYILRHSNISKLLSISEHIAASCGFGTKDVLMIRLLTEEMISALNSGISLVPGTLWFSAKNGMFTINVRVRATFFGITKEDRINLIKQVGREKNSGLFGSIRDFIDKLAVSEEDAPVIRELRETIGGYSENTDEWCAGKDSLIPDSMEDEIEIRLLKGFADDVTAKVKAKTLTLSVMKKIPEDFLLFFVESDT